MELPETGPGTTLRLAGRAREAAAARGVRAIHVGLIQTTRPAATVVIRDG